MLERVHPAEPRVEHAVSENEIGSLGMPEVPPGRQAGILPDVMRDHVIKATGVRAKPGAKRSRIMILTNGGPKRVDHQVGIDRPRAARTIETRDLDRVSLFNELLANLSYARGWPALREVHRGDHMQQLARTARYRRAAFRQRLGC